MQFHTGQIRPTKHRRILWKTSWFISRWYVAQFLALLRTSGRRPLGVSWQLESTCDPCLSGHDSGSSAVWGRAGGRGAGRGEQRTACEAGREQTNRHIYLREPQERGSGKDNNPRSRQSIARCNGIDRPAMDFLSRSEEAATPMAHGTAMTLWKKHILPIRNTLARIIP
jgi:hypothetical protein